MLCKALLFWTINPLEGWNPRVPLFEDESEDESGKKVREKKKWTKVTMMRIFTEMRENASLEKMNYFLTEILSSRNLLYN